MGKPFYRNALDRTGRFIMLDVRLLQLPPTDIKVYSVLMRDAISNYNGNHAKLSISDISKLADMDKKTIIASLKRLVKEWHVISRRKSKNSFMYYFLAPKIWTLKKISQRLTTSTLVGKINAQIGGKIPPR